MSTYIDFVRWRDLLVQAIWTYVDIGLDSSVVEHLTSDAGFTGSNPGPASHIFIHTDQIVYMKYTEWDIRCVIVKLMKC